MKKFLLIISILIAISLALVAVNEVKFNNTWYDTDFTIACGNGFLLW